MAQNMNHKISLLDLKSLKLQATLSTFDHWLSEEEADRHVLSYPVLAPGEYTRYIKKEEKFLVFYNKLYQKYGKEFFVFATDNSQKVYFPSDSQEFIELCITSLREGHFIDIYIPSLRMLVGGSYDLNLRLLFQDKKSLGYLKALIGSDLYILM